MNTRHVILLGLTLIFLGNVNLVATAQPPAAETENQPAAETGTDATANQTAGKPAPEYSAITTLDPQLPIDQLQIMVQPLVKSELEVEAEAWFELLRTKAAQIGAARLSLKKINEAIAAGDEQSARRLVRESRVVIENADSAAKEAEQKIVAAAKANLGVESSEETASGAETSSTDATSTDATSTDATEEDAAGADSNGSPAGDDSTSATAQSLREKMLVSITDLQNERTAIGDRLTVVLDSLELKGGDVTEYRNYLLAVSGLQLDTSDASAALSGIVGWLVSQEGGQRWAWNFVKFALILFVTWMAARFVATCVNWLLDRKVQLTQLAENLISRTIKNVVMLIGFAIALTALEIDITPIIAAIGATGLVVGLALQGTLSNFASGLMILINRPFDVGDVVNAAGVLGTVKQMNLVSTKFLTFDNQTIYVPNNEIWNNVITNITANETRRVDLEFGIAYSDDFEQAEQAIREVVQAHELVLSDPEPVVVTHALADSSVQIVCRPWAKTSDWWQVKTDLTRSVKRRFDELGISIPFPQQDVYVHTVQSKET
jgi:small conductance mechanosensitive channel